MYWIGDVRCIQTENISLSSNQNTEIGKCLLNFHELKFELSNRLELQWLAHRKCISRNQMHRIEYKRKMMNSSLIRIERTLQQHQQQSMSGKGCKFQSINRFSIGLIASISSKLHIIKMFYVVSFGCIANILLDSSVF